MQTQNRVGVSVHSTTTPEPVWNSTNVKYKQKFLLNLQFSKCALIVNLPYVFLVCVTAFNELNETRFLDGHFCPLLHAHYTFNGRICSTKYLHWKKPLKRCYCRTSDGIGMNFNATKYHGSDYNYKGGSISNITDGNYSDDPHLDNFLTGGMTPDNLTEEWGTKGVRHAMKHWFVSKGKKGKCLSINLTMICPQLTKPRVLDYFLVTFIPEHNYEKREERVKVN